MKDIEYIIAKYTEDGFSTDRINKIEEAYNYALKMLKILKF